jgi:hypothetical protein
VKKRISLIVVFCLFIALMSAATASAWTGGPVIANVDASSIDPTEGNPRNAFNNARTGFWHTNWQQGTDFAQHVFPQSIIVELDAAYYIDCLGFLPRLAGNPTTAAGAPLSYEIWVSTTGSVTDFATDAGWTRVANGTFNEQKWIDWGDAARANNNIGEFVNIDFDPVQAKLVRLTFLEGRDGWAMAAAIELGFLGVDYTPMEGFTPRSAPGTPAPSAAGTPPVTAPPVTTQETPPAATTPAATTPTPTPAPSAAPRTFDPIA